MQDLLELALDDQLQAARAARRVLEQSRDAVERSYAHQCLGIVLRDSGRVDEALAELRRGLRAARSADRPDREADVRATYGVTLAFGGRTRAALSELERAVAATSGEVAAKVRFRQAAVLAELGQNHEALSALGDALRQFAAAGDLGWEARSRVWMGHLELRLGNVENAEHQIGAAERILRADGVATDRLAALENLAEIAVARGHVADGLRRYAEATHSYRALGLEPRCELVRLHAAAYLAAGLADMAVDLLAGFEDLASLPAFQRAQYHLFEAGALLAYGDAEAALVAARTARDMFHRQQREWFRRRALLQEARAEYALRGRTRKARGVALALHGERADEAPLALVLAGRLARGGERLDLWRKADSYRTRGNGLVRTAAHLARALERAECRDVRGVLQACAAGLDAIDEHRRLMGSSELRALATTHGRELAEIALRHAAHDPRTLLRWSERTRATALAQPPATSDAATIPASLAALRENGRRLTEARQAGEPTEELDRERLRLERAVRAEHHTQAAAGADPQRPASVEEVVAGVRDGCLVELVDVDGVLHVLVVHGGRVRRRVAGTTSEVAALLGPTAMLLRRASRGRPADTGDVGQRLQEAILGDAVRLIPDGPVTVAPTARLHGLAWSVLPVLHDRPFNVVPSAGQWLRAREATRPRKRRTVLVAGPDLESGGAEVPILADRHRGAVLLDGADATVPAVLDRIDGADLAHLATHGHFRADSPLFSSLDLADGPLTVHDLERLRRAPYRVVLSACESGVLAPVGAQELLGLAAALFSIGTAGLVSSVGEVNDAATAALMVGLHDGLAAGKDPASALLDVRQAAAGDPVAAGTAAAFLALGV
jgi:hypothetical protein